MPKPSDYIKKGWCQGAMARDVHGNNCSEDTFNAIQWCIYGAIYTAYPTENLHRESIFNKLTPRIPVGISRWNDDPKRTQAEVVALLESIGE